MEYLTYGKTGLEISRLCFGAGHLDKTYDSYEAGGKLMLKALDEGITSGTPLRDTVPNLTLAKQSIKLTEMRLSSKRKLP